MSAIVEMARRRHMLIEKLIEPARAAANQMKDAGMHRGADPVLEILFQIDAAYQEIGAYFKANPEAAMDEMIAVLKRNTA